MAQSSKFKLMVVEADGRHEEGFLDAMSHLYKRVSVRLSVSLSVHRSVRPLVIHELDL